MKKEKKENYLKKKFLFKKELKKDKNYLKNTALLLP
jgi:hypothetical protein